MVEANPKKGGQKQQQQQKNGKPAKKDDVTKINELGQMDVGMSKIMLWHRPTMRTAKQLKELRGVTMIVTV